jgi:hypothetical protein
MTFEEILDQASAMLQRRGRVAYRTSRSSFISMRSLSQLSRRN